MKSIKLRNKIIYIIGAGRSGTTLLDIILGNGRTVFSAGELNRFTKRDGIPPDAKVVSHKQFWADVNVKLAASGYLKPFHYYPAFNNLEYHLSVFFPDFLLNKVKLSEFSNYQLSLFAAIGEIAGRDFDKDIIVDSSKYPMRALRLSRIFGDDISFIYLRRNPVAVVESFQKRDVEQPPKSRLMANLYLLGVNLVTRIVLKKLKLRHKVCYLEYEKLLASPVDALDKLEKELLIDLSCPKQLLQMNRPLRVGPLFDGNRLRLSDSIKFRKDTKQVKPRAFIDKFFFTVHKFTWYN